MTMSSSSAYCARACTRAATLLSPCPITSKEELQFNDSDFEDDEVAIVEGGAECLDAPDDAMDPDPNDPRRAYYF